MEKPDEESIDYVVMDDSLRRPTDLAVSQNNAVKAKKKLELQTNYRMKYLVQMMDGKG